MKPQRFQPLNLIYKNLRTVLYETVLLLHTTDFTKAQAKSANQKVEEVLAAFEYQTALEESLLFPSIYDYEPMVTALLLDDHRERRKQIRKMQQLLNTFSDVMEEHLSILFAGRLINRFNDFMMLSIEQMRSHETMITPVLWRYYSDEELRFIAISLEESPISSATNLSEVA